MHKYQGFGVKIIAATIMLAALTACGGGPTFVRKDAGLLKAGERVGVLVASEKVTNGNGASLGGKVDREMARRMGDSFADSLMRNGFTPILIPSSPATEEFFQRYRAIPRDTRMAISAPEDGDLGGLHEMFKENDIAHLLIFEGESVTAVNASASQILAGAAAKSSGSETKPITITYTAILEPDGKFSFYNRDKFTGEDIVTAASRKVMADREIQIWMTSLKK